MQTTVRRHEQEELERRIAYLRSTLTALETRLQDGAEVSARGRRAPRPVPATAETPLPIAAG